jgi:hypothetical protein
MVYKPSVRLHLDVPLWTHGTFFAARAFTYVTLSYYALLDKAHALVWFRRSRRLDIVPQSWPFNKELNMRPIFQISAIHLHIQIKHLPH